MLDFSAFVCDELGPFVRQGRKHRVVFGSWLSLNVDVNCIHADMHLHILFEEALLALSRGSMPEHVADRAVDLAALAMSVDHGADLMTDPISVLRLGVDQYVSPPVRAAKTPSEWAEAVSKVLGSKHDPRRKPLAAIRAAFLKLVQEHELSGSRQVTAKPEAPHNIVHGKPLPPNVRLCFGLHGLTILDEASLEKISEFEMPDIESWSSSHSHLDLVLLEESDMDQASGKAKIKKTETRFMTPRAIEAQNYVANYVNILVEMQGMEQQ